VDIESILSALGTASRDDLAAAAEHCRTEGARLAEAEPTEDNVTALERMAAARGQIVGEIEQRDALSARREAARSAMAEQGEPTQREDGAHAPGADGGDIANPAGDADEQNDERGVPGREGEQDDGADNGDDDDEDDADGDGEDEDEVTASGRRGGRRRLAPRGGEQMTEQRRVDVARGSTRVQGNVPGMTAGTQLDAEGLAQAMLERFTTIRNTGADGVYHVARTVFDYPEHRRLLSDNVSANLSRIDQAIGPEAQSLVAAAGDAGGLCAPLQTLYDIPTIGDVDRPVLNALTRFQVARGGIQYRQPFDALSMSQGIGTWTMDDDIAAGDPAYAGDPAKTCYEAVCPGVEDAVVYSTYLCLTFPNVSARFDREWVDATTRSAQVTWARYAENLLLAQMSAASKVVTAPTTVSAVRDVLVNLDKIAAWFRSRYRLNSSRMLRWIAPSWLREILRSDLTRGHTDDLSALAIADAQIEAWFRTRHVNVTWHLDGLTGATVNGAVIPNQFYGDIAAGDAIPEFIDTVDGILYPEGEWLALDGGTLDLGLVRDSALNARNRYQQFTESWEGTAFRGLESLRTVFQVRPTGASVGTIEPIGMPGAVTG
jgi:hypothetical protein